jgi:hypothetical protein
MKSFNNHHYFLPTMISVMNAQMDKKKKRKANEPKRTRLKTTQDHYNIPEESEDLEQVGPRIAVDAILDDGRENLNLEQPNHFHGNKWQSFVNKMTKKDVGIFRSFKQLPNSIGSVFDTLQLSTGLVFKPEERKSCYHLFTIKASSLGTIQFPDMEELLSQPSLEIGLSIEEIRHVILRERQHNTSDLENSEADPRSLERDGDVYTFQRFAAVVADARLFSNARARSLRGWSLYAKLRAMFPIDPEATWKQVWDALMLLLLLYCSFSVPYEIAFMDSTSPELDLFGILVP